MGRSIENLGQLTVISASYPNYYPNQRYPNHSKSKSFTDTALSTALVRRGLSAVGLCDRCCGVPATGLRGPGPPGAADGLLAGTDAPRRALAILAFWLL